PDLLAIEVRIRPGAKRHPRPCRRRLAAAVPPREPPARERREGRVTEPPRLAERQHLGLVVSLVQGVRALHPRVAPARLPEPRDASHRPIARSLRPPPYASAVSNVVMPSSHARSMIAAASSSLSPPPKNSGADPIPPKLPQPRMIRETSKPLWPSARVSISRA